MQNDYNDRERDIWTAVLILACVFVLLLVEGAAQAYAVIIAASLYLYWRYYNALKAQFFSALNKLEQLFNGLSADVSEVSLKISALESELKHLKENAKKAEIQIIHEPAPPVSRAPAISTAGMVMMFLVLNLVLYLSFKSEVSRLKGELTASKTKLSTSQHVVDKQAPETSVQQANEKTEVSAALAPAQPKVVPVIEEQEKEETIVAEQAKAAEKIGSDKLALRCIADECNF